MTKALQVEWPRYSVVAALSRRSGGGPASVGGDDRPVDLARFIRGQKEGQRGDITLAVHRLEDGLMLRIRDFAPKVDQAKIRPRPLDEVRPGGLGTHFIRAVMDDANFIPLPDGEGNLLELVKRRKKD